MPLKSSNTHYGTVAITVHWLSAALIVLLLATGFRAGQTVDPLAKAEILRVHAPLGFAILLLTLFRIVWWWRFDNKPAALGVAPRWQEKSASTVHLFFYFVVIGMAASGIGMLVLSGAGPIFLVMRKGDCLTSTIIPHASRMVWARGSC